MTFPSSLTRMRSEALIMENATPKGLTQNVVGSTGSRSVMWPATPSSKPYLPKILNAAPQRQLAIIISPVHLPASLPLRYARSLYGSSNFGRSGKLGILTLASPSLRPGSRGARVEGFGSPLCCGSIAEGGDMILPVCSKGSEINTEV